VNQVVLPSKFIRKPLELRQAINLNQGFVARKSAAPTTGKYTNGRKEAMVNGRKVHLLAF